MSGRIDGNRNLSQDIQPTDAVVQKETVRTSSELGSSKTLSTDVNAHDRTQNLASYGQQQKERVAATAYGVGGASALRDAQLYKATAKANAAYQQTFERELQKFADYSAKVKNSETVADYQGAKNYVEVATRAEKAYRGELQRGGFAASDVRGRSVLKAADFLQSKPNRTGELTSLSAEQIKARIAGGDKPSYLVRLVEPKYMDSPETRLAAPNRKFAWVAAADEIAGTKGDLFETMRRIGYKESDIEWTRQQIADGKKSVSDYALAIVETDAAQGRTTPLWNTVIDDAKANNLAEFKNAPSQFWEQVKNFQHDGLDYDAHIERMGKTPIDNYIANFPNEKAKEFGARYQIQQDYGANPLFTGDGTTLRPDAQNARVGAREWFVENIPLRGQQKSAFIALQDLELGDSANIKIQSDVKNVVEMPLRLRSEMRAGGIVGGAFSAVTSLPQVFEQAKDGDYLGAATTLGGNTALGTTVGSLSAVGERIVGSAAEKGIVGRFSERGANLLVNSNTVGRIGGRGLQNVLGQSISTGALRQVVGRVAGSSVIGGAVNGGFAVYDQWQNLSNPAMRSQAIGTIVGEVGVGVGAGLAGAAAGAVIGSIVPVAGTAVGAVVGFVVGVGVGMAADAGLRYFGANTAIARNVTSLIDNAPRYAAQVQQLGARAVTTVQTAVTQKLDQARAVVNRVSDAGRAAQTFVNQKVAGARQKVSQATEAATQFVAQAKHRVSQTINRAATQVQNRVNQVVSSARAVTNRVSNAARTAQTFVNQKVTQARQTVSRATTAVSSFVAQTRQNVTNTVRNGVNNAAAQMRNVVNNTVENARATVTNAVGNLAGNAVSSLRSVFGW